jgi:hypothetical protein
MKSYILSILAVAVSTLCVATSLAVVPAAKPAVVAPKAVPVTMAMMTGLPNRTLTPGMINPNVTQANIKTTICKSGWTSTIRPTGAYTNKLKLVQMTQYNYADKTSAFYEEDHLISLELGGHPTDPKNLWPEPYNIAQGARVKDQVEDELKRRVCAGKMPLATAQAMISTDWIAAHKQLGLSK